MGRSGESGHAGVGGGGAGGSGGPPSNEGGSAPMGGTNGGVAAGGRNTGGKNATGGALESGGRVDTAVTGGVDSSGGKAGSPGGAKANGGTSAGAVGVSGESAGGWGGDANTGGRGDAGAGNGGGGNGGADAGAGGLSGNGGADAGGYGGAGGNGSGSADGNGGNCDVTMEFGQPTLIPGLDAAASRVRFSPDEKLAYLSHQFNTQHFHIAIAERSSRTSAFSTQVLVPALWTGPGKDLSASVPEDGLTLYFESARSGTWQMHVARRNSLAESFSAAELLVIEGLTGESGGPFILPDHSALYFHGGDGKIYRAARTGTSFAAAVAVAGVNTDISQGFPVVSGDELTLYFISDRWGTPDMWVASRSTKSEPFGTAQALTSLNTDLWDMPTWISPDGCRLYFERTSDNWLDNQMYVVERKHPPGAD